MVEGGWVLFSNTIFQDIMLELRLYLGEIRMGEGEEAYCCPPGNGTKEKAALGWWLPTDHHGPHH